MGPCHAPEKTKPNPQPHSLTCTESRAKVSNRCCTAVILCMRPWLSLIALINWMPAVQALSLSLPKKLKGKMCSWSLAPNTGGGRERQKSMLKPQMLK